MTDLRSRALNVVKRGLEYRDEPFELASGELSHDYIDAKLAVSRGADLETVCRAIIELVAQQGVEFDAVGGLTMGADALAHGTAMLSDKEWFSVRKDAKSHGKTSLLVGAEILGKRVILVDDVVTTGNSIAEALTQIEGDAGEVVLAVALVDRSGMTGPLLEERGVVFKPLFTWKDLKIEPVGMDGRVPA